MPEVVIESRTLIASPTPDDPNRKVYQIQYSFGALPPHFVYISEKEWTKAKEKEVIKADIEKRMEVKRETITI